ncbi:MAG: Rab family GTPase [Candidatus Heimdallarchaeota archaeon]
MEGIKKGGLELTYKICIFGDKNVGKTTLVNRYVTNQFHENIQATLGASIHVKYIELENGVITLQVWDFGGHRRFKFLISSYAQGSAGGIFMFDLTNYESLIALKEWLPEFGKSVRYVPLIMVGGKLDLEQQRVCKEDEVLETIELYNFHKYIECSSKTGENVDLVFRELLFKILEVRGHKYIKFK